MLLFLDLRVCGTLVGSREVSTSPLPPCPGTYTHLYVTSAVMNLAICPQGCSEENFQNSLEASSNASISSKAFYNDASTLHSPAALAPLPLIDPPATPAQTSRAGGRPKSEHISPIDPSTPRRNSQGQLSASKITVQLPAKQASATTPNSASPGRDYEAEARRRKQKEPFTPTMVLRKQPPPFNVSPQRPPDPKVKRVCEKAEKALKQEVQRRNETQQRVQILAQQHARDAAAQNKLRIEREAAKISTLEKLRLQQLAERNARVQSSMSSGAPLRSHTVVWFSSKIAALKNMISAFNCFSKAPQPSTNA